MSDEENFGEDETMMRVKFFDAVRKVASMPEAISVEVRSDLTGPFEGGN